MPRRNLSKYHAMWLFVIFDLPVTTAQHRRNYTRFRKGLLKEGFSMLQYSVYAQYFPSEEASVAYRRRVRVMLPPAGEVRLVSLTDRQFEKMEVFMAKTRVKTEGPPEQLLLF
jgi:CRISPR-associated protein Cas2